MGFANCFLVRNMNSRLSNFELLRILAMFGILINHFFNKVIGIYDGFGIDVSNIGNIALWSTLEMMKLAVLPSVDCYILISGYFMIERSGFRWSGILRVWTETFFYSVSITALFLLFGCKSFSVDDLKSLFPLCSNEYWFISSYIMLMLFAPFISMLVAQLSKKQYQLLLAFGILLCFEYPFGQYFLSGQQLFLFMLMYLIGGYIKLYVGEGVDLKKSLLAGLIVLMIMFSYTVVKNIYHESHTFRVYAMAYNGLVLPLSVCVFLMFKNIKIRNKLGNVINKTAPLALAVYLIHEQPLFSERMWAFINNMLDNSEITLLPLHCLIICSCIFLGCVSVDYIRRKLAHIVLNVYKSWKQR